MEDGTNIVQELREAELSGMLQNCPKSESVFSEIDKEDLVKKIFFADDILDDMLLSVWNCL